MMIHHYQSADKTAPVAYAFTFLNSEVTLKQYPKRLQLFFESLGLQGDLEQQGQAFIDEVKRNSQQWAQEQIMLFMNSQKKRVRHQNTTTTNDRKKDEISASTIRGYIHPIKLFYEAHDLPPINWRRITRALPKARKASNDRAPTREEIRKVIGAKDRRVKPIVLVMCSSGIRLGAWDYLRWKHIIPQKNDKTGEIVAAKLIVYTEEYEEYSNSYVYTVSPLQTANRMH